MADFAKMAKDCPGVMKGFGMLHHEAIKDGALSSKDKELISLGIAVAVRCAGCIQAHVKASIDAGATRDEICETVGVAVLMSGGPGTIYGSMAIEVADQFLGA